MAKERMKFRFRARRGARAARSELTRRAGPAGPLALPGQYHLVRTVLGELAALKRRRVNALAALHRYRDLLRAQFGAMQDAADDGAEDAPDDDVLESCEAQLDLLDKAIAIAERELGVVGATRRPETEPDPLEDLVG